MKILIVTQVVDKNHPILGFFHRWVEEFAKHCEKVTVICLEKGEYTLPENVTVYSLGKESRKTSSLMYTLRLQKKCWKLRKEYDSVFVHMIPEYVIAGFPVWKLLGKKIGLWYTHGSVSRNLRIAEKLVGVIFTATKEGCNLKSKKISVTGHGIDAEVFASVSVEKDIDLVTIGRISPSKNLEVLLDVLVQVRKQHDVTLTLVGASLSEVDEQYKQTLIERASELGVAAYVIFLGAVSHEELPEILSRSRVFVHTAVNGSLDKALLEPLAVGLPVVSTAEGARSLPLGDWFVEDISKISETVFDILDQDTSKQTDKLRVYTKENHSILSLISKICKQYQI